MWVPSNHKIRKKILIIQTSPMHTGSTLLINLLYGLFESHHDKKIIFLRDDSWESGAGDITILKSHNTNIDELIKKYKKNYDLYFVCSERPLKNLFIDANYKNYRNVVSFHYNELNETLQNPLQKIASNVGRRVFKMLKNCETPINFTINVPNGIKRIIDMNHRYNEIKELPFSYIDDFYEIHGSHRGRSD